MQVFFNKGFWCQTCLLGVTLGAVFPIETAFFIEERRNGSKHNTAAADTALAYTAAAT